MIYYAHLITDWKKSMPNHVTNVITIVDTGGVPLEVIHNEFLDGERQVNFNRIKPEPSCLVGFEPHHGIIAAANAKMQTPLSSNPMLAEMEAASRLRALEEFDEMSEHDKQMVSRAIDNINECGYAYWYEWRNAEENWGTKWNAYGQPDEGFDETATVFMFETAWSHPDMIIKKLSENLPAVTFHVEFADEDLGSNVGTYTIKGGEYSEIDVAPNYSEMDDEQKAHYTEMAFKLCHPDTDPREWGYGEDWKYDEEIEEKYSNWS